MLTWLVDDATPFPPSSSALGAESDAPGLLAAGGKLSPARLLAAYRRGIFPWYSAGQPPLWWCPDPRMVLPVPDFHLSRSLQKTIRAGLASRRLDVRVDTAFDRVIQACASTPRAGQSGTWILPDMQAAYGLWHRLGHVHSVETWWEGRLVGGLYAVSVGRMIFGESMFAWRTDASKIALAALVALARRAGVPWIDCQQDTRHLASLGARTVTRPAFEAHLATVVDAPAPVAWSYDSTLWDALWPAPRPNA